VSDADEHRRNEHRRTIRRFVQEHHPDRGGDPQAFSEGLSRLREGHPASTAPAIEAYHRRGPIAAISRSYQRWKRSRRRAPHPKGRVQ
jgi:hypothetical protein